MTALGSQIQLVCYTYIAPTICGIGILTNILNLIVLSRPPMKGSAYTFLTALASADMITLVLFFMYLEVSSKVPDSDAMVYWFTLFNVYVLNPGLNISCCASVWIIVLITIDRCLSVRFPFLAKSFCSVKYARRKVMFAFVLATVLNAMRLCQYTVTTVTVNGTMFTKTMPTSQRGSLYFFAYLWIYAVVVMYVPSVLLVLSNTYLLVHLRLAGKRRLKMIPNLQITKEKITSQSKPSRLNASLIAITFFFVVCIMPSSFSEPCIAYTVFGGAQTPEEFFTHTSYRVSVIIANLLVLGNASLNFFLYCAFNEKFSETMQHILWRTLHKMVFK